MENHQTYRRQTYGKTFTHRRNEGLQEETMCHGILNTTSLPPSPLHNQDSITAQLQEAQILMFLTLSKHSICDDSKISCMATSSEEVKRWLDDERETSMP